MQPIDQYSCVTSMSSRNLLGVDLHCIVDENTAYFVVTLNILTCIAWRLLTVGFV